MCFAFSGEAEKGTSSWTIMDGVLNVNLVELLISSFMNSTQQEA